MAAKITKEMAKDLIAYGKRIHVKMHHWDPKSASAFEFYRQMNSENLKKINPSLEVTIHMDPLPVTPTIAAEFYDGSKWERDTSNLSLSQLRSDFYQRCAEIEDEIEMAGGTKPGDNASAAAPSKGAVKGKK